MIWFIIIVIAVLLIIVIASINKDNEVKAEEQEWEKKQETRRIQDEKIRQRQEEEKKERQKQYEKAYNRGLVIQYDIAGLYYRSKQAKKNALKLEDNEYLWLNEDKRNKYDSNAIKISSCDTWLGYVPAEIAEELKKDMHMGITFDSRVSCVYEDDFDGTSGSPKVEVETYPKVFIENLYEKSDVFAGKRVITIGNFNTLSKTMISEIIRHFGGTEYWKITAETNIDTAIIGHLPDERKMTKINKWESEGKHIEIFSEKKLQEMLVDLE